MIATLLVIAACLLLLAWVLTPLRSGPRPETGARSQLIEEAEGRKRAALYAIIDIEEEAEIGKLSPSDLAILRDRYERDAVGALQHLDQLRGETRDLDDDVEAEIARLKKEMRCTECGATRPPQGTCPRCGKD
jgi:hypothetical protein